MTVLLGIVLLLIFNNSSGRGAYYGKGSYEKLSNHTNYWCNNEEDASTIAQYFHFLRRDKSNCPVDDWLLDMRNVDPNPAKVIINIGFNKGYKVAKLTTLWAPFMQITPNKWYEVLIEMAPKSSKIELCGFCQECHADLDVEQLDTVSHLNVNNTGMQKPIEFTNHDELIVIGIDLNPTACRVVNTVANEFTYLLQKIDTNRKAFPRIYTFWAAVVGIFDGCEVDMDDDSADCSRTAGSNSVHFKVSNGVKSNENMEKSGESINSNEATDSQKTKVISHGFFKNTLTTKFENRSVRVWNCENSLIEGCKIKTKDRLGKEEQRLKKALKLHGTASDKYVDIDAISIDQLIHQLSAKPEVGKLSVSDHLKNIMGRHYTKAMDIRSMHEYISIKPYARSTASGGSFHRNTRLLIDILVIDTEGFDGEVLRGAGDTITKGKVRCIMFTYNSLCPWGSMKLRTVLNALEGTHIKSKPRKGIYTETDFVCYIQGTKHLWRLTGCWDHLYEFHQSSNIICVQRGDIWYDVLEKYVVTASYAKEQLVKANKHDLRGYYSKHLKSFVAC